ncbi:platelet-activating factor acetylhydrolase IB subunit alpha2-like [Dermatophagoides pteronyssinus]|uniref:platelet-activating factor acetylhydrolase IB subunit alpha2-like n=1 Tax=Dermatophagoides pteronyssinus TaxID=6956 RepID=UPI003F663149
MYNSSTLFLIILAIIGNTCMILSSSSKPWDPVPQYIPTYQSKHQQLLNQTKQFGKKIQIVFLGDSIVENWLNNGKKIWQQYYEKHQSYNYGIGGDLTQHVLWRIDNGELDGLQPKLLVLLVGTNNVANHDKPADVGKAMQIILKKLLTKLSNVKILLMSIFPRGGQKDDQQVDEINEIIKKNSDNSKVFYLDVTKKFRTNVGQLIEKLYMPDKLHLSEEGYKMWQKIMQPMFDKLLK